MIFEFKHTMQGGKEIKVGFNVEKVLTCVTTVEGDLRVSLDDWHEEIIDVPQFTQSGKHKDPKRERRTINTEIYLKGADADRFKAFYVFGSPLDGATLVEGEDIKVDCAPDLSPAPETETIGENS